MALVDISVPLRDALLASSEITSLLAPYKGSRPIFIRRPIPEDAPTLCILISQDIVSSDDDGVNDRRLVIERDITVYGSNDLSPAEYRKVGQLARLIHSLFHNKRHALEVPDWDTVLVTATGPTVIPQDDAQLIAQGVFLTVQLASSDV